MTGARVGLDIGGSKVLGVLLVDREVRRLHRVAVGRGADGVVAAAVETVRALGGGRVPTGLLGVGLGVPGIVDHRAGTVAHAVNLGIGEAEPLGPRLAEALGVPVVVENDLTVAALGAADLLGLGGDLAYLALGTGVAAGLLLDGRLRRGHRGAAGEVGHLTLVPDGLPCPCGQRGCLELYASGSALDAAWPGTAGTPAPEALFRAAATGDAAAVDVRDRFADAVAAAVQTLVLTTDVAHVVLGGGVAAVGEPLRSAVADAVRRRAAVSGFLTSLHIDERLHVVPAGVLVAPVGAALAVDAAVRAATVPDPGAPATAVPATDLPATDLPTTDPPTTDPPTTAAPTTDALAEVP